MKISASIFSKALVALMVLNILFVIYPNRQKYLSRNFWEKFPILRQEYLDSQYVNKHPKSWIPDEIVNSYAGAAYIKGTSPILIAPDTPPLGRYISGLSSLLFSNENIFNLFFVTGSLFMLYKVGMQIFNNQLLSVLPPFLLSFEPLFLNQLIFTPLLDIMQLFYLLCVFYFFNKAIMKKKNIWINFAIANFFLGCFISTKFYITGITIIAALVATALVLKRFKDCLKFLFTISIAVAVLLLTYVRVLFDGYTFTKFLGIQKYVFFYHKSQLIHPFSIWSLILLNKWYVWFGDKPIISDAQWRITWPVLTVGSFLSSFLIFINRIKVVPQLLPLIFWTIFYFLFFSFGQVASRYFIILLPVLYIITVYGMNEILKYSPSLKRFIK